MCVQSCRGRGGSGWRYMVKTLSGRAGGQVMGSTVMGTVDAVRDGRGFEAGDKLPDYDMELR